MQVGGRCISDFRFEYTLTPKIPYIRVPTLVKALQISSRIVSLHRHCEQSSIYNEQGPHIAVNGERGGAVDNCIHTQVTLSQQECLLLGH